MANRKLYSISFRRQRKGKTGYKKRLKLLLSGKPRLVIRKSIKQIFVQAVDYDEKGDKILLSCTSYDLKKNGWKAGFNNLPSAYLTGVLMGKKCLEKGIKEMVPDIGLNKSVKGSKMYAVLKGVIDSGVNINCSEEILPPEGRIKGEHIKKYAEILSKDKEKYNAKFGDYIKNNFDPTKITENFEATKNKILGEK